MMRMIHRPNDGARRDGASLVNVSTGAKFVRFLRRLAAGGLERAFARFARENIE
jgi:hypothetical protein